MSAQIKVDGLFCAGDCPYKKEDWCECFKGYVPQHRYSRHRRREDCVKAVPPSLSDRALKHYGMTRAEIKK